MTSFQDLVNQRIKKRQNAKRVKILSIMPLEMLQRNLDRSAKYVPSDRPAMVNYYLNHWEQIIEDIEKWFKECL